MTDPATVEQLLARLAPHGTGVAACHVDSSLFTRLSLDERAVVRSARSVRRAEFAAGRSCAHRALAAIGADTNTVGCGSRRQPDWPSGVTGSISHAAGLAMAVAAHATPSVAAIGIDLELADRLDEELWQHVLTPSERAVCAASHDPGAVAGSVFSAKEAAFKAVYPLRGEEIDFLDAHATLESGPGTVDIPSVEVPRVNASVAIRLGRAGPLVVSVATIATGE